MKFCFYSVTVRWRHIPQTDLTLDSDGSVFMYYKFSYDKLWHRMIDLKLKKKDLQSRARLSSNVIAKMGRGESVTLDTLAKICVVLNCGIADLVDFTPKEV